jgi:E3 ubiquitin-protein ligase HUWE1
MTKSMLKHVLAMRMSLKDLEDIVQQQYDSLTFLLENNAAECGLTFAMDYDEYGVHKIRNLIPNGVKIEVVDENKEEYVKKVVEWRLGGEIQEEIDQFVGGFHELIPLEELQMFRPSELDLLICGVPEIDLDDFRTNCQFIPPYGGDHPVIQRFFVVLGELSTKERGKFLVFLTGSSAVPVGGFSGLGDIGRPIRIGPGGDAERFPQAHTCMHQLDLPEYESEEDMKAKLLFAIRECNSFGFA